MGKHSRELNTGLTEQQRVKHSIEEKARLHEEERCRTAEQWKQLLGLMAEQRKQRAQNEENQRWVKIG